MLEREPQPIPRTGGFFSLRALQTASMRDTSPRWRRSVDLLTALLVAAVALRRRRARDVTGPRSPTADDEVSVELDSVSVGDDLSIATGGLDPTVVANVMELNAEAAELVDTAEEELVREPIETATGGAVEVPDVEDEVARRIRETEVTRTAIDELEALGFRGMLDFGARRRDDEDGE